MLHVWLISFDLGAECQTFIIKSKIRHGICVQIDGIMAGAVES